MLSTQHAEHGQHDDDQPEQPAPPARPARPGRPGRRAPLPELWGTGEIAAAYATSTNNVANWRRRYAGGHSNPFPAPQLDLRMGPIWYADDVRAWHAERQRRMNGSLGRRQPFNGTEHQQ